MCTCASCEYTDSFAGKSFAEWPRGNPAGRTSASDYSAHAAFSKKTFRHEPGKYPFSAGKWTEEEKLADYYRKIPRAPVFPCNGTPGCGPTQPAPKWLHDWINRERKASPTYAEPARPAQAGKPEQHFPAQDRPRETARIYAMSKAKLKTQAKRGRPALPGRRVVIKLEERHIERARQLGGGGLYDVAAGIRKALERRG